MKNKLQLSLWPTPHMGMMRTQDSCLLSIGMIINALVLQELISDVLDLALFNLPSALRALLVFRYLIHNVISELIFLNFPTHKPLSVETDQMIPVEAFIYSHQVRPLREQEGIFFPILILVVFQAYSTSASQSIIIFSEDLSDLLMCFIDHTCIILIVFSLMCQQFQLLIHAGTDFIYLPIIKTFSLSKDKCGCFKWIL